MALNIKNKRVEELIREISILTGESKTEAVMNALKERKDRLSLRSRQATRTERRRRFLEREIWERIPPELLGKTLTSAEEDDILGYGREGV